MPQFAKAKENVIKLLNGDEREHLRPVFENEFDSELPYEDQANVVAVEEDGETVAFAVGEALLRTDMWWVSPRYRNTSKASVLIRRIARYLFQNVPHGSSVVIFAENENQERLFQKLGFRHVPGKIYRLDV